MLGQIIFNHHISFAVRGEKDETSSVDVNETPTVLIIARSTVETYEFIGRAELLENHTILFSWQ